MIESDIYGCYEAIRKGSHSFYAASKLLPKPVRDLAVVLYAFCRVADDNVDAKNAPQDAIDLLRERLELAYLGTPKNDPVDRAFASLVDMCEMPKELPDALLEGLEWDSLDLRFETLSDLHSYSAFVSFPIL